MNIVVSIIVPNYNGMKTLSDMFLSVLTQTFSNWELIIIDDGSSDQSTHLIEQYIQNDQRIKLIKMIHNSGPAKARNTGIKEARGKYIAFLDADDMWHPQKLEIVLSAMEKYNLKILGHEFSLKKNFNMVFNTTITQENLIQKSFWNLLLKNFAVTPSIIVTKDNCLLFDESMHYAEDHELWLRMAFYYKVYFLDMPLVALGRQPLSTGGLSSNKFAMRLGEMKMYLKLFKLKKAFIFIIPFLLIVSLLKHIVRLCIEQLR